ncbi:Peptidase family M50 [Aquisphaera giovannonii]|uniref:Peptidase family M50 n=1 Tax=Aquisphaera giovannonii TaxID=406548 RepID=A0A5B9VW17_9BACT|nr:site-2 protease family protein [Aquisphaera giovannonii]QEH32264.1 Peptidase family M50 [Aquisphaera giovannonii]
MSSEAAHAPFRATVACPSCGTELAPSLLACPACHQLIHADHLKALAHAAEVAERDGDLSAALAAWRQALALLPPSTRQHAAIVERIAGLSRRVEGAGPLPSAPDPAPAGPDVQGWSQGLAGAGGVAGGLALAAWKFKFLAFMLLGKAKLLLLGLTKASTFFSMFAMVGVYWAAFGLPFALGLVLSIYVHEMGHVAMLMRYGVPATAPLFIPGLGAVIRLQQAFADPREDARVGLAGPTWGLAAAAFCGAVYLLSGWGVFAALTHVGAFINLFNLIPIWQLDGSRAFHSLDRPQRWLAAAAVATAWALTGDGLLVLITIVAAGRAALSQPAPRPDRGALVHYVLLVATLSALAHAPAFHVRGGPGAAAGRGLLAVHPSHERVPPRSVLSTPAFLLYIR